MPNRSLRRQAPKILGALVLVGGALSTCTWIARLSLPIDRGARTLPGLDREVQVGKDREGIAQIEATSRVDLSQALGFVHAQERFFQMDFLRRASAGELSEIFGKAALEIDQRARMLGFRAVAREIVGRLSPLERSWLEAYTRGVNQGLAALRAAPPEYWLLNVPCVPWRPEDTFLVCYNLFSGLQDSTGVKTYNRGLIHALIPDEVARFLTHNGSSWESTLDQSRRPLLPIPDSGAFAYLRNGSNSGPALNRRDPAAELSSPTVGSNCWAITSDLTESGRALLASDMHLRMGIPNIWYRAQLRYLGDRGERICLDGATLPGIPALIMGSNGRVAWGFTNSQVNTVDLLAITLTDGDHYLTSQGERPLKLHRERIRVKGAPDFEQVQHLTIWGPLQSKKFRGRGLVARWVARECQALNLNLMTLETARDTPHAIDLAKRLRTPALNFFAADLQGRIGWALIGSIPDRSYSAALPRPAELPGWQRQLAPDQLPHKVLAKGGYLWNCNNQMLEQTSWGDLGSENMINGIRAFQVEQALKARGDHTAEQMLQLQMCERALFYDRWHRLLLNLLSKPCCAGLEKRAQITAALKNWDGNCGASSVGYPILRRFRDVVGQRVMQRLFKPCYRAEPEFNLSCIDVEEPLWMLVNQQPEHLIDSELGSWDAELTAALVDTCSHLAQRHPGRRLNRLTWGECQSVHILHPLGRKRGILSYLFNIPTKRPGGDVWVPKVLTNFHGASQRMVVSPGDEGKGLFLMPCGQSGHPLSKNYGDLHPHWLSGRPRPLQPGFIQRRLRLLPQKAD